MISSQCFFVVFTAERAVQFLASLQAKGGGIDMRLYAIKSRKQVMELTRDSYQGGKLRDQMTKIMV